MTDRQETTVWILFLILGTLALCGLAYMGFRSADENRDKGVHMMQECITAGGTWLGDSETCVQQHAGGL